MCAHCVRLDATDSAVCTETAGARGVAALSKLESAYQRHKAVVDSRVLLPETGDKVKEQRTRVQQTPEAALETSREAGAYHAGCGRERRGGGGTLAGSNLEGRTALQHRQLGAGILPGHARAIALEFPWTTPRVPATQAAGAQNAVPATIPASRAASFVVMGASSSGAAGLANDPGGHHNLASLVAATLVAGAQGQGWHQAVHVVHQQQYQQQHTRSILDIPNAKPTPSLSSQCHSATHVSLLRPVQVAMPIGLWANSELEIAREWRQRRREHGRGVRR